MAFHVKTTVFEGPLDLLLQLITRHQVEVTSVGLTGVVSEYLAFLEEIRELDLEVTSEFLLIAATLIQLKAHSLLPRRGELDMDEELALIEERDRLLSRLLAYVTFKDVAAVLGRRLEQGERFVPREAGLDGEVEPPPVEVSVPVDAHGLALLAARVMTRLAAEVDLEHLDLDLPSVEEAIGDLRSRLAAEVETDFEQLTEHCRRPVEVAAYFLALLELARWGLIQVRQGDWLAPIEVRSRPGGDGGLTSEWAR